MKRVYTLETSNFEGSFKINCWVLIKQGYDETKSECITE